MTRPDLTVIVPVFNEERTLHRIREQLTAVPFSHPQQGVFIINDGSTDGTKAALRQWENRPGFVVLHHATNHGKGAAVRTGLAHARGKVTVIQDADLKYNPAELPNLVELIVQGECDIVYGSRYLKKSDRPQWSRFRLYVNFVNMVGWALYGIRLTDIATCYKALPTDLYHRLELSSERFELCTEMTAKLFRLGVPIRKVPISYHPRTRAEGKKIGWRDIWPFTKALIEWRFRPRPGTSDADAFPSNLSPTLAAPGIGSK